MTIATTREALRAYARNRKEHLLDEADHLLLVLRDGTPVAALSSGALDPLLRLAGTAASGYGAQALALVVEGVVPLVAVNPLTGEAWQRGEAEQVWLEHDGVAQGWVAETQILAVAERTGETVDEGWPFRLASDTVEWADAPLALSGTGLSRAVAARMRGPVVDPARVPDPGDRLAGDPENGPFHPPEYGRVSLDIGCTRVLGDQLGDDGEVFLIVESCDRADYLIREGLPLWQVEVSTAAGPE